MSRFDEEPDGDPHGECALEIARLESQRDQYYKCFLAEQTEHAKALAARDKAESELASLRQKQVLWEAGNRELADRLEARDVAIDALRAEKERAEREAANVSYAHACEVTLRERAEAERDEAIRMRDRHAEASKAQNEDITALMAERDAALKDAEKWRMARDRGVGLISDNGREGWDYHTKEPAKECQPEQPKRTLQWK